MVAEKPVSHSIVTKTEMVYPTHTNSLGSVFGGIVMSWVDIAAAIAAQRHSSMPVVTASIDDVHFVAPVYQGWIVNLKASVNFTSKRSMEIGVRVDAENPIEDKTFHTASAYLTFVALGPDGKPAMVSPVKPETKEQMRRFQEGEKRRALRLERRQKVKGPTNRA